MKNQAIFYQSTQETPLGEMLLLADATHLYLCGFSDTPGIQKLIQQVSKEHSASIVPGQSQPIVQIKCELTAYFNGECHIFSTPLAFVGTLFQKRVWGMLQRIAYGATTSYRGVAQALSHPTAFRAVANANRVNRFAVVVPCHRVIKHDGTLCGYNGGLYRKQWLLDHEQRFRSL